MVKSKALEQARILSVLIHLSETSKILDTFIKAFIENSFCKGDGNYYLHGNFNLGGTKSGRLSSSGPNLQNIPSTSTYAKLIKGCFISFLPEWIFAGIDFDSLEDKISALTTRDPNKEKVYLDGYDGHCLRAYSYFKDQMPDIVDTVESINSIAKKYKDFRQESKGATFALTYQGTWYTLHNTLGFSKKKAKAIEKGYHELYVVADKWVETRIEKACSTGYVTGAFNLRLRTPILKQVVFNTSATPYEAKAEARTAGNMLGQSYGMLNNRAAIEFHRRLMDSEYLYDIKPVSHIHDAQYFLIKNTLGCVEWFNNTLVECLRWQELDEIKHPDIVLGGAVDLFIPDWSVKLSIPNQASRKEIRQLCIDHAAKVAYGNCSPTKG